jgi:hypothetical protein
MRSGCLSGGGFPFCTYFVGVFAHRPVFGLVSCVWSHLQFHRSVGLTFKLLFECLRISKPQFGMNSVKSTLVCVCAVVSADLSYFWIEDHFPHNACMGSVEGQRVVEALS